MFLVFHIVLLLLKRNSSLTGYLNLYLSKLWKNGIRWNFAERWKVAQGSTNHCRCHYHRRRYKPYFIIIQRKRITLLLSLKF